MERWEAVVRIAVVGSGIAGAATAWLLSRQHDVTLFERDTVAGGHTRTVDVPDGGRTRPVDTGFIVYNTTTYPLFVRLLDELGVASQASDMSWSLACSACDLAYAGDLRGALAQPRRLLDMAHLRMLVDVARFNRAARAALGSTALDVGAAPDARSHGAQALADGTPGTEAIVDFLDRHRLGDTFRRHYLLPMVAAIWSSGTADVRHFPVRSLLTFFANHGLLGVRSHLPWRTVTGGARTYMDRLLAPLGERVRTATPVLAVRRDADAVRLRTAHGTHDADAVVLAGHADESLALLEDPDERERELLGAWRSTTNDRWVHTDASLLPAERAAWASWNYHVDDCRRPTASASLSYDLTRLQRLDGDQRVLVSINPIRAPRADTVVVRDRVSHATYDPAAVATQPHLDTLNGVRRTYYAGAWQRWGFHEDGLWSAVRVAAHLGVSWP
jgi:uncharacterized protein